MRVVFDTNVVVSAMLFGGRPGQALRATEQENIVLLSSESLLEELWDVLSRPKFAPKFASTGDTVEQEMEWYQALVEMVTPADISGVVPEDPKDDKIVACAVGGEADAIVSGDHHLLELGNYEGVRMITIDEFLTEIQFPPAPRAIMN